jgi:hypothetical protein
MLISELTPEQLDYWVAQAQGLETFSGDDGHLYYHPGHNLPPRRWNPSRYWSQGGPIIEQQRIDLNWDTEGTTEWSASIDPDVLCHGPNVLEAAMRAFVTLKFGEQVAA